MTAANLKPRLSLIALDPTNQKANQPKMKTPAETEAEKIDRVKTLIKESIAEATMGDAGQIHHKHAALRLEDQVCKVRNSLAAVCALTRSTQSHGKHGNGELDTLAELGRDCLVDLLEIISDRLSTALELDGS